MEDTVTVPSGWKCSIHMDGKPMELHNMNTEGKKTEATIICEHGKNFTIHVSRSAEGYDQAAEDEHLSPDRGMTVLIDGLWIDSYTFWGRTVNQVISGKKVSLDEVRSFVFTKPQLTEDKAESAEHGGPGTIVIIIEGVLRGDNAVDAVWEDATKEPTVSGNEKKGHLSSLVTLADRIPAPAQSHRDDSQTEYDLTHPFWTITFRYHTQDMFNALFKSEDEERREEQLARDHGADNPIEINDSKEVIDVDEFSEYGSDATIPQALANSSSRRGDKRKAPCKAVVVKDEQQDLSDDDIRRADEVAISKRLRRISRTKGNFVDISKEEDVAAVEQ